MELSITPESILNSLQYMENLIEGRIADNDLAKVRLAENRIANLFESQLKARGCRELLLFCEPSSVLFVDELFLVLGKIEDFLIWAKSEMDIATRQL